MNDPEEQDHNSLPPLGKWERILALGLGILSGGAGGYAVFTSPNQAGTAVLLVLSAVFCLIGIQGTPLIRMASGSNSFELDRRRRSIDRAVAQAKEEKNTDKAVGIVEGAVIAEPNMRPMYRYMIYELELQAAILKMGYHVAQLSGIDGGFDLSVNDGRDHMVYIEAKYSSRMIPANVAYRLIGKASDSIVPVLLVSNSPLTKPGQLAVQGSDRVEHIIWGGPDDDRALQEKLGHLFEQMS